MTVIKFGKQFDESTASFKVNTTGDSPLEISVDDQHDRSKRKVVVEERSSPSSAQAALKQSAQQSHSRPRIDKTAPPMSDGADIWIKGSFFLTVTVTVMATIAIISIRVP